MFDVSQALVAKISGLSCLPRQGQQIAESKAQWNPIPLPFSYSKIVFAIEKGGYVGAWCRFQP